LQELIAVANTVLLANQEARTRVYSGTVVMMRRVELGLQTLAAELKKAGTLTARKPDGRRGILLISGVVWLGGAWHGVARLGRDTLSILRI
jgi:hypothetical protein